MNVLRWVLVPAAAVAAWAASLFVGVILHDAATGLCPESQMVSGACVAPWWPYADVAVLCISAAFAAATIVLASALTAPSHRPTVAVIVFGLGCVVAVFLAIAGDAYLALPAAGLSGALAVRRIIRGASLRGGSPREAACPP